MAMCCLAVIYLTLPYRVFYQNKFDVAEWDGHTCYLLGERAPQMLLFCPNATPSRNVRVEKGAAGLRLLGRVESIFTQFDQLSVRYSPSGR